ncbi:MAG: family 16 glycoside hydrolase [Anaerohalosphaeraceae bacterium]
MRHGWIILGIGIVSLLAGCQPVSQPRPAVRLAWDFEMETLGTLPASWMVAETAGKQMPATWEVVGDSWGKAIGLTQTRNTGDTCNLLLAINTRLANIRLSAKIKANRGKDEQGGGIVWRAQNEDNYYAAQWDSQDKILRLYYVVNGKRTTMQSVNVQADPTTWHTLEVEHYREHITISMDGQFVMKHQDDMLPLPGMIGLWTQADAVTMFDEIRVDEIK